MGFTGIKDEGILEDIDGSFNGDPVPVKVVPVVGGSGETWIEAKILVGVGINALAIRGIGTGMPVANRYMTGAVVIEYQDYATFIPLQVCEGVDVMMGGVMGYYNAPDEVIKGFKKMTQMDVQQMGSECMSTWYGIQTTPEAIHRA